MSPIEIETGTMRVGPLFGKTPVRRAKFQDFLQFFRLARYLGLLDWTGANCNKYKVGKDPDTCTDSEALSVSILLAGVTWWRKSGGCSSEPRGTPEESSLQEGSAADGLVVRPRESARRFRTKADSLSIAGSQIRGSGEVTAALAMGCLFPRELCWRVRRSKARNRLPESQGHTQFTACDLITSFRRMWWPILWPLVCAECGVPLVCPLNCFCESGASLRRFYDARAFACIPLSVD